MPVGDLVPDPRIPWLSIEWRTPAMCPVLPECRSRQASFAACLNSVDLSRVEGLA